MKAYWFIRTKTTYEPSIPIEAGSQEQFNRNVSYAFSGLVGGHGNAGDLLFRASDKAIANYMLCDGSALSRSSYKELYGEIGEAWGAGDGLTTFNIPTQDALSGLIATPPATPPQTVSATSVSSGTTVETPTEPSQTGGTTGGDVDSGGGYDWQSIGLF